MLPFRAEVKQQGMNASELEMAAANIHEDQLDEITARVKQTTASINGLLQLDENRLRETMLLAELRLLRVRLAKRQATWILQQRVGRHKAALQLQRTLRKERDRLIRQVNAKDIKSAFGLFVVFGALYVAVVFL